jgi:hypothetical protein
VDFGLSSFTAILYDPIRKQADTLVGLVRPLNCKPDWNILEMIELVNLELRVKAKLRGSQLETLFSTPN